MDHERIRRFVHELLAALPMLLAAGAEVVIRREGNEYVVSVTIREPAAPLDLRPEEPR